MRNPARSGSSPPARSRAAGATTARAASAPRAARAGGLPLRRAFEVAGFRFSAAPGTAGFPLPAAYRDFAAARYRGPGLTRVGLGVSVRPGLRAPADPIFRADAWSIARSREGLLVTLCPPALRGRALAAARLRLRPLRVDAAVSRAGLPPFSYPVDQVLFMHLLATNLHYFDYFMQCGVQEGREKGPRYYKEPFEYDHLP